MNENLNTTRSSVIMAMNRRIKELEAQSVEQEKEIERLNKELEIWLARSYDGKIGSMALKNLNLKMEINKLETNIKMLEKPDILVVPKFDNDNGNVLVQTILSYSDGTKIASEIVKVQLPLINDKAQTSKRGSWGLAGIISCQDSLGILHRIICSRCAKDMIIPEYNIPNYCPNCGTDMRDK